ncbi:MAG: bifunctional 5,10-methylenetetrahydrofolate dehydrogenase/5,10-methenyltetrahydrofolate cyclohydrolase [Candidatus Omnitrophica bacterium]|nr:bifunctional 5,10-methylenetetrahydrofolate dehydrogenase/5,10-methenyltetrahydrofolate cyclohydrolase [Candidatus Omnitrophota bacterium]
MSAMKEALLLEGSKIAKRVEESLREELRRIQSKYQESPKLVAIQVGTPPASALYVKKQKDTAGLLGIQHELLQIEETASESDVIQIIQDLNRNPKVHGIILELPMPAQIHPQRVLMAIDAKKDAEGIHVDNLGRLLMQEAKLIPSTALAAFELVLAAGVPLAGKEAVVVGQSKIVGRPAAFLLLEQKCTVTICHTGTAKRGFLEAHVKRAEVLIVAVGKPNMIPGSWIREGAIVVDVGINRVEGKTVGDVDFEGARSRAAFITPVPGGVGPLTVTMLMKNVVQAYLWQKDESRSQ